MRALYSNLLLFCLFLATYNMMGCGSGADSSSGSSSPNTGSTTTSQSGSTAAMLPYKDALYVLDGIRFKVFDTSSPEDSVLVSEKRIFGIETLFVYNDQLYIGGANGVTIYNVEDPLVPVTLGTYSHARGCDPIILSDEVGYITLRNREGCGGDVNRLEIVDFKDPLNPIDIATLDMDFPYGLAQTEQYLAICQDNFGLSLIDAKIDKSGEVITAAPEEVANYTAIKCFDLIYSNEVLLATASDGIYQFKMDGIFLEQLSVIPVGVDAK